MSVRFSPIFPMWFSPTPQTAAFCWETRETLTAAFRWIIDLWLWWKIKSCAIWWCKSGANWGIAGRAWVRKCPSGRRASRTEFPAQISTDSSNYSVAGVQIKSAPFRLPNSPPPFICIIGWGNCSLHTHGGRKRNKFVDAHYAYA